jgi:hypothetical protein
MLDKCQEDLMRRLFCAVSLVVVALVAADAVRAEVTTVRMHIAGYLCGN